MNKYKTTYESPLGTIYLECDGTHLTGAWFKKQSKIPPLRYHEQNDTLKIFTDTKNWYDRYFNGQKPSGKEILIKPNGTDFQIKTWMALYNIPYGRIASYHKMGDLVGKHCLQTIGVTIGLNPIAIIIPDHRVVSKTGHFKGFSAGVDKQIALLKIEGLDTWCHPPKIFFCEKYFI